MSNFRRSNRIKTLVFLLCISLIVVFYGVVNLFSAKYFSRRVFDGKSRLTLSDESKKILKNLKSDVEIFVLLERQHEHYDGTFELIKGNISHLMGEYVNSAGERKFSMEILNAAKNSKKYADLCERFGILPMNCVVIATNDRVKVLAIDELYRMQNGEMVMFRGEQVISVALMELTSGDDNAVYFLSGHGESQLDSVSFARGLSAVKHFSRQQNCKVRPISLFDSKAIPFDADLVVIAGARGKFLGFEVEILRDFVDNRNGKLVVALDGNFDIGLREFLGDYGIFVGENLLVSADNRAINYAEDLMIRHFAPHRINEKLIEFQIPVVFGATCEVKRAPWFTDEEKFEITELLQTGDSVIESGIDDGENTSAARVVATLSERKKFNTSEITTNAGKILVVGNADFMANGKVKILGNRIFWLGISNYMLHGSSAVDFEGIEVKNYRLALSRKDLRKISARILVLPAGFLLLTVAVAFLRRK
ncbi:MAG: GldG family protein [Puniceicoccales bacterium]|jgi:hypothetical protein|nr:GldG family protein [Puniceicoccales bacterium]